MSIVSNTEWIHGMFYRSKRKRTLQQQRNAHVYIMMDRWSYCTSVEAGSTTLFTVRLRKAQEPIDVLVQERRNYIVMALQLRLSCTNPSLFQHGTVGGNQGPDSIYRCHLTSIGNPIVEIRRSYDRLISTMGFLIPVRWHLYIESGHRTRSVIYWCIL